MATPTTRAIPGSTRLLPNVRAMRQHGFLKFVELLWQEHGDLFQLKLGSRKLIFAIHPDMVRQVTTANRQNYDKVRSYESTRRFLVGDGLITSTGELWRQQRHLLAPFYTPKGVQAYADIMLRDAQRLLVRWQQDIAPGAVVDMAEEMTFVTAAIILKAMFSMETTAEIVRIKDAVETMIMFTSNRQRMLVRPPLWVPTALNRRYLAARQMVHSYVDEVLAKRRNMPQSAWPDDLLTRLMQARDEETGATMSESLIRDESITTFFAGHETTARTMTFAWYALATHPQVAARLHEEIDNVLGDRQPTLDDLHRLPYTLQVIKETLRLYPAAPFYVRDAVGDDTLAGYPIVAGDAIMLSPYYTHRHPDFWEDPLVFNPDRWTPERQKAQHPFAYHPFSAGQRICIGNNFSLLETHILLVLLAQRFAPRLPEGFTPQWRMQGTLGTANGMPMILEPRR